jgi:hypothetical protein
MRGRPARDEHGLTQSEHLFADRVLGNDPGPDAGKLMPAKKGDRSLDDEARQLLNTPRIRRYVDYVRARATMRAQITQELVIGKLKDILDVPPTDDVTVAHHLQALELLGKYAGRDKPEPTQSDDQPTYINISVWIRSSRLAWG